MNKFSENLNTFEKRAVDKRATGYEFFLNRNHVIKRNRYTTFNSLLI